MVARTETAKSVTALHRLYGLVEGDLAYAVDMAAVDQPLQPHLSARLARVPDGDLPHSGRGLRWMMSRRVALRGSVRNLGLLVLARGVLVLVYVALVAGSR